MGARPEGLRGRGAGRRGGGRGMSRDRGTVTSAAPAGSPTPEAAPATAPAGQPTTPAAPEQTPAARGPLTPEQRQARRERRVDRLTERAAAFTERSKFARSRANRIEDNMEAGKGRFAPSGEYGAVGPLLGAGYADLQRERAGRLKQKAENMRARAERIRSRFTAPATGTTTAQPETPATPAPATDVATGMPAPVQPTPVASMPAVFERPAGRRGSNADMRARRPANAERNQRTREARQGGGRRLR